MGRSGYFKGRQKKKKKQRVCPKTFSNCQKQTSVPFFRNLGCLYTFANSKQAGPTHCKTKGPTKYRPNAVGDIS